MVTCSSNIPAAARERIRELLRRPKWLSEREQEILRAIARDGKLWEGWPHDLRDRAGSIIDFCRVFYRLTMRQESPYPKGRPKHKKTEWEEWLANNPPLSPTPLDARDRALWLCEAMVANWEDAAARWEKLWSGAESFEQLASKVLQLAQFFAALQEERNEYLKSLDLPVFSQPRSKAARHRFFSRLLASHLARHHGQKGNVADSLVATLADHFFPSSEATGAEAIRRRRLTAKRAR